MRLREYAKLRGRFRRRAKAQCSKIHKNLDMGVADDDILGNFWLEFVGVTPRVGRRGRRKFIPVWSAAFVAESGRDD